MSAVITQNPDTPRPQTLGLKHRTEDSSPTKYMRIHEKEDLAQLNNRLACYIDKVRSLECENRFLKSEVSSFQERLNREVTAVKTLYDQELSEARLLLDELAREKAKLQIDSSRLFVETEEVKHDFQRKIEETGKLQESLTQVENKLIDISKKNIDLKTEKKKLCGQNEALLDERNKLVEQLNEARKELEVEVLRRVDAENSQLTAKEEFSFREQALMQQLEETHRRVEVELTISDEKLNQEYKECLYKRLQEIREQYENDLNKNKKEIKKLYEEKVKNIKNQLAHTSNISTKAIAEVKLMQKKIDRLNHKIKHLVHEKNLAEKNCQDLENKLEQTRTEYMDGLKNQEYEINKLREEMSHQLADYQDLMDIKVALDLEIAAYRKLLEGEEARLNITPVASPGRSSSSQKVLGKRRLVTSQEEIDSSRQSFSSSTISDISSESQRESCNIM